MARLMVVDFIRRALYATALLTMVMIIAIATYASRTQMTIEHGLPSLPIPGMLAQR